MRAAVMRSGRIEVAEVEDPQPQTGEVLVKTLACGICGSDLHALQHGPEMVAASAEAGLPTFRMDLERDVVMGHEFCAEVVGHGAGCKHRLPVGTRVCAMPIGLRQGVRASVGYSNDLPGGYGELMLLQESLLLEVPNALESDRAALTEPMAVGVHAVEMARLAPGDLPLVVGCGPVGLAVIAALRGRGVEPIVASDFSPRRRELALLMGAHEVVDPAQGEPMATWMAAAYLPPEEAPERASELAFLPTMPALRPAVIFECVGVPGIIDSLMKQAPPFARIVVVGVCMERDRVHPFFGISRQLNLQFVLGYTPEEFSGTLRDIAEGTLDVAPMITGSVGVDEVADAFDWLATPDRHAKIVVEPWR